MSLEDLTGTRFINDLNPAWPAGTDLPDAGDDHIRGIKNVLQKSFPQVAGPVTRSDVSLSRGSIPVGSVLAFYMAAAPAGWERVPDVLDTFAIRVVASATPGGGSGGTHDPVLNDKVPSHTHTPGYTSNGILLSTTQANSTAGLSGGTNAWVRAVTTTGTNSGSVNWQPRYLDMILCQRTS